MSVKRLNYLQIPVGQRRTMAKQARAQIKMAMNNNPAMTADDKAKYVERLDKLAKWEAGTLAVSEQPTPSLVAGTNHEVVVSESVSVEEEGG